MSEAPILVVDDDPTILATVSEALDFEGFPVITATNGAEALELIDRNWPSLVLLDMRMPGMSGLDVLNVIALLFLVIIAVPVIGGILRQPPDDG